MLNLEILGMHCFFFYIFNMFYFISRLGIYGKLLGFNGEEFTVNIFTLDLSLTSNAGVILKKSEKV